jgi:hypothetical protein
MRKLLTLWIALATIVLLSRAGNAADFTINIGEAAPGRLLVVGLACKGTGATSVSSKGTSLKREVTTENAGETLDLWSGVIPTGSGEQTFSIAGCIGADPTIWRLDDLKSTAPVRTVTGEAAKNISEPGCCTVTLNRGDGKPSIAAVYR